MEPKKYSVSVIPDIKEVADPNPKNEGAKIMKATYVQLSKPDEKARAKNFLPTKYIHTQLFEEDPDNFLGGDTKAVTLNIFENVDPVLFNKLEELINSEDKHSVLKTDKQVMLLNEKMPGLVRNKACAPYYATYRDKVTGETKRLQQNTRDDKGNFTAEPVVLEEVSFFLFANKVNEDDEAIQMRRTLNRISSWVKGTPDKQVAEAKEIVAEGATADTE